MIGINLGSLNTSVAYGKEISHSKYKYELLLSDTSKRTCPSILTFTSTHRLFGDQANLVIRKHLKTSFKNLSRYIGIIPLSPFGNTELSNYYIYGSDYDMQYNEFILNSENLNLRLKPESIILAYLNLLNQKYIIDQNLQVDFYIYSFPDYFTCYQKDAYSNIIRALKLKKDFHMINESSAITLYFGYKKYKEYFVVSNAINNNPNSTMIDTNVIRYVIFIDSGYSKTTFTLSKLTYNYFTVLKCETIPFLGGRDFDSEIFNTCALKFNKETGCNIAKNKKIKLRLLDIIAKCRRNLTVNNEVTISCDCLCDDNDFSLQLTRNDFENIIHTKVDEFKMKFNDFYLSSLALSNEANTVVSNIEIAGELMRTPALQKVIKDISGMDVSKAILTDECIAIGCALYGCIMKGTFPIKEFNGIYHVNNYTINYAFKNQFAVLAEKNSNIPKFKSITITKQEIENENNINISFYHPKEEIEFYLPTTTGLLIEYTFDIKKIFDVNSNCDAVSLEIIADNNGYALFNKAQFINKNKNAVDIEKNVFMQSISISKVELYSLYKNKEECSIKLMQQEKELFKIDKEFNYYYTQLNIFEGKCYGIRNKVNEKKMESKIFNGEKLIDVLKKIEDVITQNRESIIDLCNIKKTLEEILIFITPGNVGRIKKDLLAQIEYEQNKISEELMQYLSGKNTKHNQKEIEDISNILNHFKTKVELCDDLNTYEKLKAEFTKEISKY